MDTIRRLFGSGFIGSSTAINAYVMAQTVRIILEAQDEAAAYHNNVAMGQAAFSAPSPPVLHSYSFLNSTGVDPYPIDPFPRSFWYMFFLVSPTAALIWYNAVELTFDGLLGCMLWPQLCVLRAVKDKGYHLSRNHREFFAPLILSIFIYWYNMIQIVRVYRTLVNGEEERRQMRFRTIRRGEVHPMRADLKNFNFFQLRSLECELKYLLTEIVHPRARANISQRLVEVKSALQSRRWSWSGPPSRTSECVVCWSSPPEKEFVPCGHTVLCEPCHKTWRDHERRSFPFGQPLCPQCRTTVMRDNYARTYASPLISSEEYERQRDATTKAELRRLREYVHSNPAARRRLKYCPNDAFD